MQEKPAKPTRIQGAYALGKPAKVSRIGIPLVALAGLLLLSACVYSNRNYPGHKRPNSEVATIIFEGGGALEPLEVNGKPAKNAERSVFAKDGWLHRDMTVLPGRVEITVALTGQYVYSKRNQVLTFVAVAGCEYKLDYWIEKENKTWRAYVEERITGKEIARGVPDLRKDLEKNR